MNNIVISVKDLVKHYGDFHAVKSISFDVHEGEIFGLLGPNGAGKSTTLEIIETLRIKTSGTVIVDGIDLDKHPSAIKKIIGVKLQTSGFYPGLNLVELIKLFCGLYNTSVDPMELLKKVNLQDKAKNKVKELSGGQKQRFSIATTLINKPKIVFLDEPTTGLDPITSKEIIELIKSIQKKYKTSSIIITHDIDCARVIANRMILLIDGINYAEGTFDELASSKDPKIEAFFK